jgi:hypothetical protein
LKRLVADAVDFEPVSTPKFPANREKNREFCRIRPEGRFLAASQQTNSMVCSGIPYAAEQGIILVEQRISEREQGKIVAG